MWPLGCLVIKSLLEIDYTCIPKPANGVRLRAKLESENPTGLPVGVVSHDYQTATPELILTCPGYFNGEGVGSIYIPIKYCPECGRKLGNKKS